MGKKGKLIISAAAVIVAIFVLSSKPLIGKDYENIVIRTEAVNIKECDEQTVKMIADIVSDYKGWRIGKTFAAFFIGQTGSGDWSNSIAIYFDGDFIEISPDGVISDGKKYIYVSFINNNEKVIELYQKLSEILEQ